MRWALEDFSTTTLIFWRFLLAFLLGEIFLYVFKRDEFKASHADISLSALAGFFLFLSLIFQTQGLLYTSATNSGFITSLYVIIVPIVGGIFYRHQIKLFHFILGLTAFLGMGLLLNIHDFSSYKFNQGDLLTLACAVASAFHIITVGIRAPLSKSAFRFNNYQNFWTLISVIPFLIFETQYQQKHFWPEHIGFRAMASILGLALFVSILAFFIQVRSQKILNTTTASLLCLLEAPNAFLFALFFLGEKLAPLQLGGIFLILGSSVLSIYMDRPQHGNY